MMKFLYSVIMLFASFQLNAQSLEDKVPATAESVLRIDGAKLTDKIGKRKIEKSAAFIKFTNEMFFKGGEDGRISDIGIDLENDLILFFNANTSMEYIGYIYGIEKANFFEKYVKENAPDGTLVAFDDFKVLFYEDNYKFIAWNNNYALYVAVDYLQEEIRPINGEYEYDQVEEAIEAVEVETVEEEACDGGEACDAGSCEDGDYIERPQVEISQEESAEIEARRKAEEEAFKLQQAERIQDLRKVYKSMLEPFFISNKDKSILDNKSYIKGKNPDADLYLWISQQPGFSNYYDYRYYYGGRRYYRNMMRAFNNFFGDQVYINGLFENNKISIISDIEHDAEIAKYFDEIYSTKISEKLLPYINADKAIAIASFSLKAEKIWKYYPRMYAKIYQNMFSRNKDYSEEIAVFVDFVEIFMDEKALAEIALGDGIFIFKDLAEIEVKYTTYEYSEDYSERNLVEKTRTEVYPQFLGLFTTENKIFLDKLLGLAVKNEIMYRDNQYYYTTGENRDLPFELGFTIQNGVAMIGTDIKEIKAFAEGKTDSSMPKELQSKMYNNQGYVFMNMQEMLKKIPDTEVRESELETLEYARKNMRTMEMFSNLKDGLLHSTFQIAIPSNAKNGAEYAWDFIDNMYAINNK
ncbi:hypothetical protein N8987_00595 [Crocinitomix sp.]|nr:hypothetical protein [Crocinitomix sp.]